MKTNIKSASADYFQKNAERYTKDYYLDHQVHSKWIRQVSIEKLVSKFLRPSDGKILDIGCGPGLLAFELSKKGFSGMGIDISDNMIGICKQKVSEFNPETKWEFGVKDAENTGLPSGDFACVIASGVIEYMPTDAKMLAEANRILKPGGYLILNVTNLFGYHTCLNSVTDTIKNFKPMFTLASWFRKSVNKSNYGADKLGFSPRKHFIPQFKSELAKHGFEIAEDMYIGYSLLPAPFSTILKNVVGGFEKKLDFLGGTPLKYIGSAYLVCARKSRAHTNGAN